MNNRNSFIIYISVIVIVICGLFLYYYVYTPNKPNVAIEQTNESIKDLKEEIKDMTERMKQFDKAVKVKTVYIKAEQEKYVDTLPPDDVARGVADELRIFTNRQ